MVVKSPWPAPEIPDMDVTAFVLRHAQRLADAPALIDGAERPHADLRRARRRGGPRGGRAGRARRGAR